MNQIPIAFSFIVNKSSKALKGPPLHLDLEIGASDGN